MSTTDDRIRGASYGLSGILAQWEKFIRYENRNPPNCDTLLVNLLTYVRNAYNKDLTIDQIIDQVALDVQTTVTMFREYVTLLRNHDNPSVVFYIPSYHKVPTIHLRKESPSSARYTEILKKITKEAYPKPHYDFNSFGMRVHVIQVGHNEIPHLDLVKQLNTLTADCVRRSLRDYWLISHVPLDYHLVEHLRNRCILLDSYTGNIWNPNRLGEKVFNHNTIPFNSVTHLMLGDKILLKCLLNRRDKARVIEMAQKERWMIKTKQQILSDASGITDKAFLTTVKL